MSVTDSPDNIICFDFKAISESLLPDIACGDIGSVASLVVAGTVLLSLRRDSIMN